MATTAASPKPVEIFYSYSHRDAALCVRLQNHLAGLRRSGLISDWYDRKIEPGSAWAEEIQSAMERAGIILLLISSEFLASQYVFTVEIPFALKQHRAGKAIVIPILLRPVQWVDTPFAELQILPSDARPVTSWPNRDEAFSDIAAAIRQLVYADRLSRTRPEPFIVEQPKSTAERVLDAAVASEVTLGEPTDVVCMLRRTNSGGLQAILRTEPNYSPTPGDVRSKKVEIELPLAGSGHTTVGLSLDAPDFSPPFQKKKIRIPASGDSDVLVFMLTPHRLGRLKISLQLLLADDSEIASCVLVTHSKGDEKLETALSYHVVSLPVESAPARPTLQKSVTKAFPDPLPAQSSSHERPFPKVSISLSPAATAPLQRSRSRRTVLIGIAASVVGLGLITTTAIIHKTARPDHPSPSPVAIDEVPPLRQPGALGPETTSPSPPSQTSGRSSNDAGGLPQKTNNDTTPAQPPPAPSDPPKLASPVAPAARESARPPQPPPFVPMPPAGGDWLGNLGPGKSALETRLSIEDHNGRLTAALSIPDRKIRKVPVDTIWEESPNTLVFSMYRTGFKFLGTITATSIQGTLSANGYDLPLNLDRMPKTPPIDGDWLATFDKNYELRMTFARSDNDEIKATGSFEALGQIEDLEIQDLDIFAGEIKFTVRTVGQFSGKFTSATEIDGTLTTGKGGVDLVFKLQNPKGN